MEELSIGHAATTERSCSIVAAALSEGRRNTARLISGQRRSFGLGAGQTIVHVPFPPVSSEWGVRSLTCGVALQCAPSKDRLASYALHGLTGRQRDALTLVEGAVAVDWIARRWAGLVPELRRLVPAAVLPKIETQNGELTAASMLDCAQNLARSNQELHPPALLGRLPEQTAARGSMRTTMQKILGQLPWSSKRPLSETLHTLPVAGQGGVHNPNLPPPSRPEEDDPEIRADQRAGIPYPEWNMWRQRFLPDHVAVLERKAVTRGRPLGGASPELRRWFQERTQRAIKNRLEDGSDLDVEAYVSYCVDAKTGHATAPRLFRELLPSARDVTTAILLDGSSSLGANQGRLFATELACADALSGAMSLAGERHGLFVFSGNTRHRVDVACLKDFHETKLVLPGSMGLVTGGYTRLGAPIRHLTSRLLKQPSERRLLIVIGDGLMSDDGYEGKYAWADVAHAVGEAQEAGVLVYYIGVGSVRVDPLPDVFGARRSTRIQRVEALAPVLARVHRGLTNG